MNQPLGAIQLQTVKNKEGGRKPKPAVLCRKAIAGLQPLAKAWGADCGVILGTERVSMD